MGFVGTNTLKTTMTTISDECPPPIHSLSTILHHTSPSTTSSIEDQHSPQFGVQQKTAPKLLGCCNGSFGFFYCAFKLLHNYFHPQTMLSRPTILFFAHKVLQVVLASSPGSSYGS